MGEVSESVLIETVEVRGLEGGRTSTIRLVLNVITSGDTPSSFDVASVAVLKILT